MKNFKILFLFFAFIAAGSFMTSCGGSSSSKDAATKQSKEYASAYICPMYCKGSGSDKPGICPVCEMDYEKNPNYKGATDAKAHDGHDHDNHDGHDHGSHDGHDHDNHDGHNH